MHTFRRRDAFRRNIRHLGNCFSPPVQRPVRRDYAHCVSSRDARSRCLTKYQPAVFPGKRTADALRLN